MASSKKTKEEKEKRKSAAQAERTKARKPETKKKAKPSPKKLKRDSKNAGIQNGTVSESEEEVVEITPASSINDSQEEDSGSEEDSGFQEQKAANGRKKNKRPKKNGKEIEQEDDDDDEEEDDDEREDSIVCNFPMSRIKRIMKTQTADLAITGEAVFLVNKATDKFLEQFCEDGYESCAKDRKKTLAYNHLASVVSKQRKYDFLTDFVPEKIKAEDALEQRKLAEAAEA